MKHIRSSLSDAPLLSRVSSRAGLLAHEDEHDCRVDSDRAAPLAEWVELATQRHAIQSAMEQPPEHISPRVTLSLEIESSVFDAMPVAGRPGWTLLKGFVWHYTSTEPRGAVAHVKRALPQEDDR